MSGKKYKIYQNGQFLGHHGGATTQQAFEKMSKSLYPVIYNINLNAPFDIYYGNNHWIDSFAKD